MNVIFTSRRQFLGGAGALAAASALPAPALAQGKPKVVVIGGGRGGATAAKYIAKDSAGAIEVTLVEPTKQFVTCFHSNLYLGGFRPYQSITHNYSGLSKYGVKLAHTTAAAIRSKSAGASQIAIARPAAARANPRSHPDLNADPLGAFEARDREAHVEHAAARAAVPSG